MDSRKSNNIAIMVAPKNTTGCYEDVDGRTGRKRVVTIILQSSERVGIGLTHIAETLESQFPEIAENRPELLARHYTEAGLIEKALALWGTAGQRSLRRSALVEGAEQITRALDQIASVPGTPALRREQIKLQVALISPLGPVKGYAAPGVGY